MKEVVKSNGKKYWDKPYLVGVQNVSGNHFDVLIPIKHDQLLMEIYSDYDIQMGWGKDEIEVTLEEVKQRFNLAEEDLGFFKSISNNLKN